MMKFRRTMGRFFATNKLKGVHEKVAILYILYQRNRILHHCFFWCPSLRPFHFSIKIYMCVNIVNGCMVLEYLNIFATTGKKECHT